MSATARFLDGPFYPVPRKLNPDLPTPLYQCLETRLPVWAKDVPGTQGLKAFFACGYDEFCARVYPQMTKNVYEVLQYDLPTKVYLDFDCADTQVRTFVSERDAFVRTVKEILEQEFPEGAPVHHYVLDASSKDKLSSHVIFDFFLQNMAAVENVVQRALARTPCAYVDARVYTKNRLFRILYSHKASKARTTALRLQGACTDYNPEDVIKTLIQAFIPQNFTLSKFSNVACTHVCHYLKFKTWVRAGRAKLRVADAETVSLHTFIKHKNYTLVSVRENDSFISCIVRNVKCPWAARVHKSNHTYLLINKQDRKAWFQCADPECTRAPFYEFNAWFLWYPPFTP